MKKLCLLLVWLPIAAMAHPGIGIVQDSKGNIYYTDLMQVWKISNGKKTVAVPNVHTHELYIDHQDNLYGEGGYYDDRAVKFYHFQWVYRPNGRLDTVVSMREQYRHPDFSFARDKNGNEYYLKRFLEPHTDTTHIYKKLPGGKETVFATGNFKRVNWLHPQDDGSLLFASTDTIYRADPQGNITIVTKNLGAEQGGFNKESGLTIWGIWQDKAHHVYAAIYSSQKVIKITPGGKVSTVFTSPKNWAPLHGVVDDKNRLWVMESSDKNDVRVTLAQSGHEAKKSSGQWQAYTVPLALILGLALFAALWKTGRSLGHKKRKQNTAT